MEVRAQTVNSVATLAAREGWDGLPMFALGASSGGALAALLPFHLKLEVHSTPRCAPF